MNDWDDPIPSRDERMSLVGSDPGEWSTYDGRPLGRGGQGVVVTGRDRHLPRDVAWKTARDDPRAKARLRHEARVLAMLEHPHIVPVHDLVDDGVTVRMATRFVRGRTLRTAMAQGLSRVDVTRLTRHMLATTQAVAFAHEQGIVHRDIKPDNVMIGDLGETQVIDWGLALVLADDERGAVVGTPAYMSPEQARGERPGPASDVWSLGATLIEVVTGAPLWANTDAPLEQLSRGQRPPLATRTLPRELAAIIERALAPDPEARYPDARALAADLEAYLDGRIVAAHDYSSWQRLRRFVRDHRLPLGIGATVVVTLAVVLPFAFSRIGQERDEAVAARKHQTAALALAKTTIATREYAAGRRPEAELAAADALLLDENPDARGVLAASSRAPRPIIVSTVGARALPSCRDVALSPDGRYLLCGQRTSLSVLDAHDPTGPAVHREATAYFSATLTNRMLWIAHPGHKGLERVDLTTGDRTTIESCSRQLEGGAVVLDLSSMCVSVIGDPDGVPRVRRLFSPGASHFQCVTGDRHTLVALDERGHITLVNDANTRTLETPMASTTRDFTVAALVDDGTSVPGDPARAVFATSRGHLHLVDLRTGATLREAALPRDQLVTDVDVHAGRLLVRAIGTGATLLDVASFAHIVQLPGSEATWSGLLEDGRIATFGDALVVRSMPAGTVARLDGLIGVTAADLSRDGMLTVSHHHSASLIEAGNGHVVASFSNGGVAVVKKAVLRGDELVVAVAGVDLAPVPSDLPLTLTQLPEVRRLERLPDDRLVASMTGTGVSVELADGAYLEFDARRHTDIALEEWSFVGLTRDAPQLTFWDLSAVPTPLGACPAGDASSVTLARSPDGPLALTTHAGHVQATDGDCHILATWAVANATRVVSSGAGGWVAAGTRSGEVLVWDWRGTLVAKVVQHVEPVSALSIDPTGRWLVSGAWDGRVRFFDLGLLTRDAGSLAAEVHAAWTPR